MSYQEMAANFKRALDDNRVEAICLQINSPGGEVAGLFDLVDNIYSARGGKPIYAIVDDMACLAAYGIASAAGRICFPRTGGVGSVGVIAMHIDVSTMLTNAGINQNLGYPCETKAQLTPIH